MVQKHDKCIEHYTGIQFSELWSPHKDSIQLTVFNAFYALHVHALLNHVNFEICWKSFFIFNKCSFGHYVTDDSTIRTLSS